MWQPTATLETLQARAAILAKIRQFFAERNILEVETPLLSQATVTDAQLHSFTTFYQPVMNAKPQLYYLQTSPEFAMKRLLAAGMGAIYQITKSFRNAERGRQHNPEFSMLEWYRPGMDHFALMQEVDAFLQTILTTKPAKKVTYQALFQDFFQINPHLATGTELSQIAERHHIQLVEATPTQDRDLWLQLLMTHIIEPSLGIEQPTMVYDYPSSQAALSKLRQQHNYHVAERFEVYVNGIELANGFHELQDANEQHQRFLTDLSQRKQQNLSSVNIDKYFLQSLEAGLPSCAGVALGIDRLIMLALNANSIEEVLAFPIERA